MFERNSPTSVAKHFSFAVAPHTIYAAIAELLSTSTTNEGASFDNRYCWVCRFDGDTIVEVRAYLDSMMVDYTIQRNELVKR